MRTRTFAVSILILLCGVAAGCCTSEECATKVDVAAESQAIKDRSAEWLGLAQAKNAAAITETVYLEDATTIFDGKILQGREEILANMESNYAKNQEFNLEWTTSIVEVAASGDLAYERGSWTFDPDGDGEKTAEHGEYITIWKKVEGVWRASVDAGTTIKDQEETDSAE